MAMRAVEKNEAGDGGSPRRSERHHFLRGEDLKEGAGPLARAKLREPPQETV